MNKKKHEDYGLLFWIHVILITLLYLSWLLFSWWIVLTAIIILQLQFLIFGGCIISRAEFGIQKSCSAYYLKKWGLIKDELKTDKFLRYYVSVIGIVVAIIWQTILNFHPLII